MATFAIEVPAVVVDMKVFSLNARPHWSARHRATKRLRNRIAMEARQSSIGQHDHITVVLTFHPPTRARRDRDNLVRVQKTMVDGLVDAKVIPDDTPDHLEVGLPAIGEPSRPARWVLEVTPS